jgi:predicted component of type VI protein secretion system
MEDLKKKMINAISSTKKELERTAKIGVKLFNAGQINSDLHERQRKLGDYFYQLHKKSELTQRDSTIDSLVEQIESLEEKLLASEDEINSLKK